MQINKLMPSVEEVYMQHDFLVLIESHLTYLRTSVNATLVAVTEHQNYKYEGDLYGLLDDLTIDKKFHFIIARVNNFVNSSDFKGDIQYLIVPDLSEVELLKSIFQTKNNF